MVDRMLIHSRDGQQRTKASSMDEHLAAEGLEPVDWDEDDDD